MIADTRLTNTLKTNIFMNSSLGSEGAPTSGDTGVEISNIELDPFVALLDTLQ